MGSAISAMNQAIAPCDDRGCITACIASIIPSSSATTRTMPIIVSSCKSSMLIYYIYRRPLIVVVQILSCDLRNLVCRPGHLEKEPERESKHNELCSKHH